MRDIKKSLSKYSFSNRFMIGCIALLLWDEKRKITSHIKKPLSFKYCEIKLSLLNILGQFWCYVRFEIAL